jgi:hypothetical protein
MRHGVSHGLELSSNVARFVCPVVEEERQRRPLVMVYDGPSEVSCAACLQSCYGRAVEREARKKVVKVDSQAWCLRIKRRFWCRGSDAGITRGERDGVNLPEIRGRGQHQATPAR